MHKVKTDVEKQKDEEEYRKWMSGHKGGLISEGILNFTVCPSSKNSEPNHCSSTFQPKLNLNHIFFCWGWDQFLLEIQMGIKNQN